MASILVVEDRPLDRKFLSTLLRSEGFDVTEASDGEEALDLLMAVPVDLVISDILMPTLDGYEFVRRMRGVPAIAGTPVLFYSAVYHEQEARRLAANCGVADILTKPSEPHEILATVAAVLGQSAPLATAEPGAPDLFHQHSQLVRVAFASRYSAFEISEQRMAAIVDVAQRFASEQDPHVLLQTVGAVAREMTLAQHAVVGVISEDGTTTEDLIVSGRDQTTISTMTLPWIRDTPLVGVIKDRRPRREINAGGDPELLGLPSDHGPIFSRLTVPVASATTVYGWLGLRNKLGADGFTDQDEQFALALATFGGIAYENACRYQHLQRHSRSLEKEIAERKELERRLEHLAGHDALTGLFNRRRFEQALERQTQLNDRYGGEAAVLLIDLDNFKEVNDQFGHKAGDDFLRAVADVLRGQIRDTDVLARLGGDEFGIVLPHASEAQALVVANKVLRVLQRQTAILANQQIRVTASVGAVRFGRLTSLELLACADMAMYEAKTCGRNNVVLYQPAMGSRLPGAPRLVEMERVRQALDEQRLVLYCQPILDLGTGEIHQHELLVRLQPDGGPILAPAAFLHVAERFGLMTSIDTWVVRQAIDLLAAHGRGAAALTLNVNISAKSMGDLELVEVIRQALQKTGADPTALVFELTETAAIGDLQNAQQFIDELRSLGCRFALDDFGMGFSSLYYLKYLTFDFLKIDGDFIRDLAVNRTDQLVVEAIVRIAQGMGKSTIAEFVEQPETIELLRQRGVDCAQGYHVGRPVPIASVFGPV